MDCSHDIDRCCFKCRPEVFRPTREQAHTRAVRMTVDKLLRASAVHYSTGKDIMTDSEYDALERSLKVLDPSNDYFNKVGTKI